MTNPEPGAAVAPRRDGGQVVQGAVLRPGSNSAISAESTASHAFHAVIADLVRASQAFKSEGAVFDALAAVEAHRKLRTPDHARVVKETDAAPTEDVRLRRADPSAPVVPAGPAIDYNALAAAIVAAQKSERQEQQPQQQVQQYQN